jgi:hypothetical protein
VTASDLPALLGIRIGGKFDCCIIRKSVEVMTTYFMQITKEKRSCFVYFEGTFVCKCAVSGSTKLGRTETQNKLKITMKISPC